MCRGLWTPTARMYVYFVKHGEITLLRSDSSNGYYKATAASPGGSWPKNCKVVELHIGI